MAPFEFETRIRAGDIDCVTIYRPDPGAPWGVYAYGERLPADTLNAIQLDDGSRRSWEAVDAALSFIRRHGWRQTVVIDESGLANAP